MGAEPDEHVREATWTRKLFVTGGSQTLTIPPQCAQLAGVEPGDEMKLTARIGEPGIRIERAEQSGDSEDE